MSAFMKKESKREQGGISLLFLFSFLFLWLIFWGTYEFVSLSQSRIATQARLDICAVKSQHGRKIFLEKIVQSNIYLSGSRKAILVARGARLLGPVGALFGGLSEAALLNLHHSIASYQDLQIKWQSVWELKNSICAKTQYSKGLAICALSPPLPTSLQREFSPFPDLRGNYHWHRPKMAEVICQANLRQRTRLSLKGDPQLLQNRFEETYEE